MGQLRSLSLCILLLLATGCATTANYERILSSWVGSDADNLVRAWGVPETSFPLANGGKVLVFERSGSSTYTTPLQVQQAPGIWSGIAYYPGPITVTGGQTYTITQWCRTQFEVDSSNRIVHWRWEDNNCVARPPK